MLAVLAFLAAPAQAGARGQDKIDALEARVEALEAEVDALNALKDRVDRLAARPAPSPASAPVDTEAEAAAAELLKGANDAFEEGDFDRARELLGELDAKFSRTRAARAGKRIRTELEVIGIDGGELEVERWLQGEVRMGDGKATYIIFWEAWCPHCKREVPKLDATYQKYKDSGLNVVGLTKMTRDVDEAQVMSFIENNHVSYPMAKEEGMTMSTRFNVKGIPAAAVVKDGKVVWRGHPARVTDEMIDRWLE